MMKAGVNASFALASIAGSCWRISDIATALRDCCTTVLCSLQAISLPMLSTSLRLAQVIDRFELTGHGVIQYTLQHAGTCC